MPASSHSHPAILTHVLQTISGTLKAFAESAAAARRADFVFGGQDDPGALL
jgi:hypothetical protein